MKNKMVVVVLALCLCIGVFYGCGNKQTIALEQSEISMEMFEEVTLLPKLRGFYASDIIWHSSDSTVAKVRDGVVTSLKVGNTVVSASIAGQQASVKVAVTRNKTGRAILVDKNSLSIELGESDTITATFKESGKNIDLKFLYESSNPSVATIDQSGKVTAISRGSAVVSAYVYYKGQRYFKDVAVRSKINSSFSSSFSFTNSDAAAMQGSTLADYAGDETALGFTAGTAVTAANINGGMESAIWYSGNANDRLVFDIVFSKALENNIYLHLGGYKKKIAVSRDLVSGDNCILFYTKSGEIATQCEVGEIYTAVIDLSKAATEKTFGLEFAAAEQFYLANSKVCSSDFYIDNYSHAQPPQIPELGFVYGETLSGLNVGTEQILDFEKHFVSSSSGTPDAWHDLIWENRVIIGGMPVTKYRTYQYYGFDIVFTDVNYRNLVFWTGGYNIQLNVDGTIKREGAAIALSNELYIYDDSGQSIALSSRLAANKKYTIKIFIQRANTENVAFGLSVNSATANTIYLANPFFSNI